LTQTSETTIGTGVITIVGIGSYFRAWNGSNRLNPSHFSNK